MNSSRRKLRGVLAVFQTPYHADETLDLATLEKEIAWLYDRGADGIVMAMVSDTFWLGVQGESYSLLQTELRRRFPGTPIVVASIAADWGASYLPPAKIYGTGIYQESIAVVAPGSLEQLIESIATRIAGASKSL